MSTTPAPSPLLRGAAVTLALLSLATYVFVTSCTRTSQPDRPAVQTQAGTPAVRAPDPAPAKAPPETASNNGNAARPVHAASEPSAAPPAYFSTTKSDVLHLIPHKPTPATTPAPNQLPPGQQAQQAMQQPSPQQQAP